MPYCGRIGYLVEISRIGSEELWLEWQIRDILSLPSGSWDWYMSPEFTFGNERFQLQLRPNWSKETLNPASGFFRLDLDRQDGGPPKTFHYSVGIRGSRGVEKIREGERELSGYGGCSWMNFCSRSELREQETRLTLHGILVIRCVLKRPSAARGQQSFDECGTCNSKPIDCAFNPCGHMYCCYKCALKVKENFSCCPICRTSIQSIIKLYKTV